MTICFYLFFDYFTPTKLNRERKGGKLLIPRVLFAAPHLFPILLFLWLQSCRWWLHCGAPEGTV